MVKIEKRVENRKHRGGYVGNDMKSESTAVSGPFMTLFSHLPKIICQI